MNQVGTKIYYSIASGKVLQVTSEMQGCVEPTTKEQDVLTYSTLQNNNIDEIDYIQLEYGTLATTFNNAKSYKVNLETKKLEVDYYTKEELEVIGQQSQEAQALNSRISDISTYLLNSDETTISDIENSLLEIEKNKILEGMM